jgi:hypothetical protein
VNKKNITYLFLLLALFVFINIASFTQKSPTFDEIQHLSGGYAMLKTGNFRIGPGHPPLMRLWAALPLAVMNPEYPQDHDLLSGNRKYWWLSVRKDYKFGYDFLYKSGNNPERIIFAARFMCVILGAFLGILVYLFSKKLFGSKAGIFSLFLFTFSPSVIAHSRLVMNDIAGAAGITLSLLLFLRYIEEKTWIRFIVLALSVFLAVMLKYNAIFIFPVLFFGFIFTEKAKGMGKFILILLAIILSLNLFYGFKGTFGKKDIEYEVFERMLPDKMVSGTTYNIYVNFPLPERFMQSFSNLLIHNKRGHSSFVAGNYYSTGKWYYFPLAFLIKTPFLTLLMFFVLVYGYAKKFKLNAGEKILSGFFVLYWVFAVTAKINIGHRHLMPVYPVLFILLGRVYRDYSGKIKKRVVLYGLPAAYIISTQVYFPHYLPYFNLFVKPDNGYKYLVDSNLDWGQDLPGLKKFIDKQDNSSLILSYFGTASIESHNIKYQQLLPGGMGLEETKFINPVKTEKEYLAVSATNLQGVYFGNKDIFKWIKEQEPIEKIGYSIFVYDISRDEKAHAIIGEIYKSRRMYNHARRQYERVIYIARDQQWREWAMDQLQELDNL